MSLDPRDLKYFAVVAEHGNLRRAAEALDLSQPGLSKCLRRLERAAGWNLVRRTPKGVELTDFGSVLLTHARRLKLYLDDVEQEVADLGQGRAGHLRIGVIPGYDEDLIPQACVELLALSPKVTVHIAIGGLETLLPALRKGELDLNISGIPATPPKGLVQEHLFDDRFVAYASRKHRLARRKRLALADVAQERWALPGSNAVTQQILLRVFEDGGYPPPTIAMETAAMGPKLELVAHSDVLGFTARRLVHGAAARLDLVELRVEGMPRTRPVGLSYRRDAYLSPTARRFIEILKATAQKIAARNL
jgi:DNA-binding transcriptional LysR family regulator